MKILNTIFFGFFTLLLIAVAGLFLLPFLPFEKTIELKIVESGSMEPAIKTGSLVVIMPRASYENGDVITFSNTSAEVPTTHRIVSQKEENGQLVFTTKGDANEEADTNPVPAKSVLGKVWFSLPYAGFVLDFARQPLGFTLLIVLPALLIIIDEIDKIWRELRGGKKPKNDKKNERHPIEVSEIEEIVRMIEINCPVVRYREIPSVRHLNVVSVEAYKRAFPFGEVIAGFLIAAVSLSIAHLSFVGSTISYFNDSEESEENELIASELDFVVETEVISFVFDENGEVNGNSPHEAEVIPTPDSVDVQYEVTTEIIAGEPFCLAILADAGLPFDYEGPLVNLSASPVTFAGPWSVAFSLPEEFDPGILGATCVLNIVYTAWNIDEDLGEGYNDEEKVTLTFTALPEIEELVEPIQEFFGTFIEELPGAPLPEVEEIEEPEVEEVEPIEEVEEEEAPEPEEIEEEEEEPEVEETEEVVV